jgi:uncharacterized protein (TIGR02453 family)
MRSAGAPSVRATPYDAIRGRLPVKPATPFGPKTLTFLRALKRNNDRAWFHAHKADYEEHVKGPMLQVIERLGVEFRAFAPDLMADPKRSLYRIWRDTRFSEDKRPLKTNVAAVFPHRHGSRHTSAGLYLEVAAGWVFAGGGLFMPEPASLVKVRQRIAEAPARFRAVVEAPAFIGIGGLQGATLTRVPRGFSADHPAAPYLKYKQFLAFREWPPELATSPRFWPELLKVFRAVAPLTHYLNDAMGVGTAARSHDR